jgi:hypothetical protein
MHDTRNDQYHYRKTADHLKKTTANMLGQSSIDINMTRLTTEIRGHGHISESTTNVCARTVSPTSEVNTKPLRHINDFNTKHASPIYQHAKHPKRTKNSCRSTHAAVAKSQCNLRLHERHPSLLSEVDCQLRAFGSEGRIGDRRPGFVWGGTELADGAIYTKPIGCRSAGTGTEWIRAALSPHANATERRALTRYCYRRCWAIWRLPFLGLRVEQDHLPCGLICCAVLWRLSTRVQVQVA